MSDQAEQFDDELLSAYVDGELDDVQLAQVEQRLADDPAARQLVDELRALSGEIRSLPKESLGEDLSAAVLQRAERSMLLGSEQKPTPRPSDGGSSRRWVWAATAIAAALLLMFVAPEDDLQLKPVANVKPIPIEKPAGEMRIGAIESVADADAMSTAPAMAADDALLAEGANETETLTGPRSRAALSPPAAPAAETAAREVVADEIDPAFQVHIMLNEGEANYANFNRMLVSNGIELEEPVAEADANETVDQAAGAKYAVKNRATRQLADNQQTVQEEVLLVEAPPANIEDFMAACSSNILTCASVRVEADEEKSADLPIEDLSQYSRSGKTLDLRQQSYLNRGQQEFAQTQQGRAMRLDTNQYRYEPDGQLNLEQKAFTRGKLLAKKTAESPVQVLIILQQALGEPASAGGGYGGDATER